jgi:ribonuclease P protein component
VSVDSRTSGLRPLRNKADFVEILARPALARSRGWSLHGRRCDATAVQSVDATDLPSKLSTGDLPSALTPVDEAGVREAAVGRIGAEGGLQIHRRIGLQIGVTLPKRLIRRAVSRNLVRRLWRETAGQQRERWGSWQLVLRRIQPWPPATHVSARSNALRDQVRSELAGLLELAQRHQPALPPAVLAPAVLSRPV